MVPYSRIPAPGTYKHCFIAHASTAHHPPHNDTHEYCKGPRVLLGPFVDLAELVVEGFVTDLVAYLAYCLTRGSLLLPPPALVPVRFAFEAACACWSGALSTAPGF